MSEAGGGDTAAVARDSAFLCVGDSMQDKPTVNQSKRSADLFFKVCGFLLSIGDKLALARFLFIIQNS
jgi:hypothetical protein